ncbi:hypothetical protein PtB15_12B128 [Puccinia triticina]|nr:hypothetical protein PtB15_12B128 [Puccinia triticina]
MFPRTQPTSPSIIVPTLPHLVTAPKLPPSYVLQGVHRNPHKPPPARYLQGYF